MTRMGSEQVPSIPSLPPLPGKSGEKKATTVGPISDLSYRNYEGPLKTRYSRWWVITQAGLRQSFGQPLLYILFGLPLLRFLVAGFQVYFISNLIPNGQNLPNFPGEPEGQKFANIFWSAMCGDFNALIMMLIAISIGAGSIAADNRSNALLVYLSKPGGQDGLSHRKVAESFSDDPAVRGGSDFDSLSLLRVQLPGHRLFQKRTLARTPACSSG